MFGGGGDSAALGRLPGLLASLRVEGASGGGAVDGALSVGTRAREAAAGGGGGGSAGDSRAAASSAAAAALSEEPATRAAPHLVRRQLELEARAVDTAVRAAEALQVGG